MKSLRNVFFTVLTALTLSSCTNYGNKVSKDYLEVFYKEGITKEKAEELLTFLYPAWKAPGKTVTPKKSVQLTTAGDSVYFRMVADKEKIKDVSDEVLYLLGNVLSDSIFDKAPVNVQLTTNEFETIRTLYYTKIATEEFGEKVSSGNIEVYCNNGVSKELGAQMAEFLDFSDNTPKPKSFQLDTDAAGFYRVRMVSSPELAAKVDDAVFYELAGTLSDSVFMKANVIFQLTNQQFEPFKTINYPAQ
jgi:hypothetical protein